MDRKATDKRLQRVYNVTFEEREAMAASHDNACWICGWKPKEGQRSLAVEHDHKIAKRKIYAKKVIENGQKMWAVWHEGTPPIFFDKRREGVAVMRHTLKRLSVRGLVCWACNSLLKKGRDNPEILESAARYLRNYKEKFGK